MRTRNVQKVVSRIERALAKMLDERGENKERAQHLHSFGLRP